MNHNDFKNYLDDVADSKDYNKNKRFEIKEKIHKYQDGNSSKRVVEFIEKQTLVLKS